MSEKTSNGIQEEAGFTYEAGAGQSVPTMEQHWIGKLLPHLTQEKFDALCADIKANGLLSPIVVFQDKILDGWHRYVACLAVGIAPRFETFAGSVIEAMRFVRSANFQRRHLSQSQLAWLALEFSRQIDAMESKENPAATDAAAEGSEPEESATEDGGKKRGRKSTGGKRLAAAAEATGAKPRQVERARRVEEKGTPELVEAAKSEEISLADAEAAATASPEEQRRALEKYREGLSKTLKGAIQLAREELVAEGEPVYDDHDLLMDVAAVRAQADGVAINKLCSEIGIGVSFLKEVAKDQQRGQHFPQGADVQLGKIASALRASTFGGVCPYCAVSGQKNCETCHGQKWVSKAIANKIGEKQWKAAKRAQRMAGKPQMAIAGA